ARPTRAGSDATPEAGARTGWAGTAWRARARTRRTTCGHPVGGRPRRTGGPRSAGAPRARPLDRSTARSGAARRALDEVLGVVGPVDAHPQRPRAHGHVEAL